MRLYRKRLIPEETIPLDDDIILHKDDKIILTSWEVLNPRPDFQKGCSCYHYDEGIKISKFFTKEDEFLYYYCDIIKLDIYEKEYIFTDLLLDVKVYPCGKVSVLDIEEIPEALEKDLISIEDTKLALRTLAKLLDIIEKGQFSKYSHPVDQVMPHK